MLMIAPHVGDTIRADSSSTTPAPYDPAAACTSAARAPCTRFLPIVTAFLFVVLLLLPVLVIDKVVHVRL